MKQETHGDNSVLITNFGTMNLNTRSSLAATGDNDFFSVFSFEIVSNSPGPGNDLVRRNTKMSHWSEEGETGKGSDELHKGRNQSNNI